MKPFAKPGMGPDPRAHQALARVGSRLFLFGGSSPYEETESLLEFMENEEEEAQQMYTHDDLHVLDLAPSLRTLAMMVVVRHDLSTEHLADTLVKEINVHKNYWK